MPVFELRDGELTPFARLRPGPDLYEQEIEDLVWADLEAFTGEPLFPISRQAHIPGGGIPDVLALDASGCVVVIEIKRDIDRSQLAQCLEYAGWARLTSLDEIANLYDRGSESHRGVEAFFRDWQDFTDSATPVTINSQPRLVLVASDIRERTRSAIDFLRENAVPVVVIPVTVYEDGVGRRIVNIDAEHEPVTTGKGGGTAPRPPITVDGRRVTVVDLLDAGLLVADEPVEFLRPRLDEKYDAVVKADGTFLLPDGSVHGSPSLAATRAAGIEAYDGWHAWRVPRLGGTKLHELRLQYVAKETASDSDTTA